MDVLEILPKRRSDTHKGDYGRLLIIGGGSRYVGAPVLSALAALRSGIDLATIAAPEKAAWVMNSISPDITTIKLKCEDLEPSALGDVIAKIEKANAVVVGPGLGENPATEKAVLRIAGELRKLRKPALFDADALKALSKKIEVVKGMPWVLTPHGGEFRTLSGITLPSGLDARVRIVKDFAKKIGCTVLLKSHVDVIASPTRTKLNHTGNPGMTVGGTGDVLTGIVGTFLAQGADPFKAATAGAWVCGRAGDLCLGEKGYEFIASDVILKLPEVFREVRRR